uniref:Uncharacterized protein n=1 Tax=Candidatus Kentrum sp. DK TaxID=2126562 RepID=A0A450S2K6_9GAMM|nr:MAG: hypothetical protein BECKDK2373C_GA0170839_10133 [Candidatus Kentron sp. DK]
MSEGKPLLVIVTRGYATRDGTNDEFVKEWGFPDADEYAWSDATDKATLLVIHGYEKNLPVHVITKAIKKVRDDGEESPISLGQVDKTAIWLFHHSAIQAVDAIEQGIAQGLGDPERNETIIQTRVYESGGGVAVEGLLRVLDEKGFDFAEAVEKAATGRVLFANRLRGLQSGLLRLRLAIESVLVGDWESSGIKNTTLLSDTARELHKTVEKIVGKDKGWLEILKSRQSDETKAAIRAIKELYGPKYRPEGSVWSGYDTSPGWVDLLDTDGVKMIRTDLARFARALDLLLDAAESLPVRLPEDSAKKDSP